MIVFPGDGLGLVAVGGLYHENFHQWWGDNVSEGDFDMAFFKEGMAMLGEQSHLADVAAQQAGGANTAAGRAAFERYLVGEFNSLYAAGPGAWQLAPLDRSPAIYLDLNAVYERPKAALIALRRILGPPGFGAALRSIQRRYAGSSVTTAGRSGVRGAAARPQHRLPGAPGAVLPAVVRHRLPWRQAADHRARAARWPVLRQWLHGAPP